MKRSAFKTKALPDPQRQIKEEMKEFKKRQRALNRKGVSRSGAIGSYYEGEWIPSQAQLENHKRLRMLERAGKIENLRTEVITFKIYNEFGEEKKFQIEVDHCFDLKLSNSSCRWDTKPPKVVHTKQGRRYPWKLHADWLFRWELLKWCQPDHNYQILEKGRDWPEIDF